MVTDPGNSGLAKGKAKEGTAAFLIELEKERAIKVRQSFFHFRYRSNMVMVFLKTKSRFAI